MTLMQWDESMSVGVEELDEQHKKLVGIINSTYEAIQKQDSALIGALLEEMHAYAREHFAMEEAYMEECGYPHLQNHIFQHVKFTEEVRQFQRTQQDHENDSKIFVFLSRWLTAHIMDEDRKYTDYILRHRAAG